MTNITAIVQARIGSTRLPAKVLKKINGKEIILHLLDRLSLSKKITKIIIAIPNSKENDKLYNLLKKHNFLVFRGSENNVLNRYYNCAKKFEANHILRITGDCPLVDSKLVDKLIKKYQANKVDYASNVIERTFPDGIDMEIFSFKSLKIANENVILKSDKEHVTDYFLRSNYFSKLNLIKQKDNFSFLRITLDNKNDFLLIKKIFNYFKSKNFDLNDIINFYKKNKLIFTKNKKFAEIESTIKKNKGQKVWERAKKSIAGGNMLFSKRPDVFLPNYWPSYYKKAKGCLIEDLDGKKYYDTCIMGIGTNILGYANNEVDNAVKKRLLNGNMSTLNCTEEVYLAEKLIKMHQWAGQVRFARSGGEANAIAVRIARTYSKKEKIAFCGYHGWHDWYLATNLRKSNNLDGHLLNGLKVGGVQKNLKNTIYPFRYNDLGGLKKLLKQNPDIGIIKMEVIRSEKPKNNFLKKIRQLADEKKLVLIFDECTTGFRDVNGGIHLKYGVNPDIAMFGKAIGNGYSITSIIGKKSIMMKSKNSFISSTFWSERIGFVAGIATLKEMSRIKSWNIISKKGRKIKKLLSTIAFENNLGIKFKGLDALIKFDLTNSKIKDYEGFITKEMLKKGFLATNAIYVSISHTDSLINRYVKEMRIIFKKLSRK